MISKKGAIIILAIQRQGGYEKTSSVIESKQPPCVSNWKRIVERQKKVSFSLRTLSLPHAQVKCDNRWPSSSSEVPL